MQLIINGVKIRLHSNIYKCVSLHHKRRNRRSPQLLDFLSLLVYTLIKMDKSSNRQRSVWRAADCSTNRTRSFDNWGKGSKHLGNVSLISSPKHRTRTRYEHAWGHVPSENYMSCLYSLIWGCWPVKMSRGGVVGRRSFTRGELVRLICLGIQVWNSWWVAHFSELS